MPNQNLINGRGNSQSNLNPMSNCSNCLQPSSNTPCQDCAGCKDINYTDCIKISKISYNSCVYTISFADANAQYLYTIVINGILYNLGYLASYQIVPAINSLNLGVASASGNADTINLTILGVNTYGTMIGNGVTINPSCVSTVNNCLDVNDGDTLTSFIETILNNLCFTWNSLTPYASYYDNQDTNVLGYTKSSNWINLRGTIKKITSTQTSGTSHVLSSTNLPTGYKPIVAWTFFKLSNAGVVIKIVIGTDGSITITPLSNLVSTDYFDINLQFAIN